MSNFNHIQHRPLKAYNRAVLASNMLEDSGPGYVEDYLSQFSEADKIDIINIYKLIKIVGVKALKEMVTEGLTFTDEDWVEPEKVA